MLQLTCKKDVGMDGLRMFSFMLYAIVPALLRYAIHTPCFNAFWHSHPYIFMEMFFYSCICSIVTQIEKEGQLRLNENQT